MLIAMLVLTTAQSAWAWDAGPRKCRTQTCDGGAFRAQGRLWRGNTHLWVVLRALEALEASPRADARAAAGFLRRSGCMTAWKEGLWDMDDGGNEDSAKSGSHFYNGSRRPYPGATVNCLTYGTASCANDYGNALTNADRNITLASKYTSTAEQCRAVGKALHYMTDVTMPMHAGSLSGIDYWPMLHPALEEYVPVVHQRVFPSRRTPAWSGAWADLHPSKVLSNASVEARRQLDLLLTAVAPSKGKRCTYFPEVEDRAPDLIKAKVAYVGSCFYGDSKVDNALISTLKTAVQSTASYLVSAHKAIVQAKASGGRASSQMYELKIDCYHTGLSSEGTKNKISVCSRSNGARQDCESHKPKCSSTSDASYRFWATDLTHVEIKTDGNDGFFIDEMSLLEEGKTEIAHWGRDDGNGWCMSTDPKDSGGSWKNNVSKCVRSMEVAVNSGKSHYTLSIDCHHGSVSNAGTNDTVEVCAYNGTKKEDCASKKPDCGQFEDADYKLKATKITRLTLSTSGRDAFFIDEAELTSPNGETVSHWGQDGGRGWCLSKDPKDEWSGYADSCHANLSWSTSLNKRGYTVEIDCNHSSIDNEGTNDQVEVCTYADGQRQGCRRMKPSCGELSDAKYKIDAEDVTEVRIKTSGHDGFFMDEVILKGSADEEVAHWGTDNGKGWCLSTDAGDNSGKWKPYVSSKGCFSEFRFNTTKSKPTGHQSGPAMASYEVKIDCNHSEIDSEGTQDKIEICTYKNNKKQRCKKKRPVCGSTSDASFKVSGADITDIRIWTTGSDGFFMDEVYLYSPSGKLMKRFGRDDGKGWCLSKDRGDNSGKWKPYVSSKGCYPGFKFVLKSGKAYGLR